MNIKGRLLNQVVILFNYTPSKNQTCSSFTSEEGIGSKVECLTRDRGIVGLGLLGVLRCVFEQDSKVGSESFCSFC